jgi:hypothetical protein
VQVLNDIAQAQASVDDIFDNQDMPTFNACIEVFEDAYDAAGLSTPAVARDGHKIEFNRQADLSSQVDHKDNCTLQDPDQEQVDPSVIGGDLLA